MPLLERQEVQELLWNLRQTSQGLDEPCDRTWLCEKLDVSQVWGNPDCGLKTRGESETAAALRTMVEAARRIREKSTHQHDAKECSRSSDSQAGGLSDAGNLISML